MECMLLVKQMIDQAIDNNWILQELYATKDNEAVEVALNRLLVVHLSYMQQAAMAEYYSKV